MWWQSRLRDHELVQLAAVTAPTQTAYPRIVHWQPTSLGRRGTRVSPSSADTSTRVSGPGMGSDRSQLPATAAEGVDGGIPVVGYV